MKINVCDAWPSMSFSVQVTAAIAGAAANQVFKQRAQLM